MSNYTIGGGLPTASTPADEYVNAIVEATIAYDAAAAALGVTHDGEAPAHCMRCTIVAALPKGAQRLIENARGKGG